jgi:hypothetical protein
MPGSVLSAEDDSSFGPDGARHNPRYAVAVRDPQILQEAQELEKRGVGNSKRAFSWLFTCQIRSWGIEILRGQWCPRKWLISVNLGYS